MKITGIMISHTEIGLDWIREPEIARAIERSCSKMILYLVLNAFLDKIAPIRVQGSEFIVHG